MLPVPASPVVQDLTLEGLLDGVEPAVCDAILMEVRRDLANSKGGGGGAAVNTRMLGQSQPPNPSCPAHNMQDEGFAPKVPGQQESPPSNDCVVVHNQMVPQVRTWPCVGGRHLPAPYTKLTHLDPSH